jgi:hypothetical protein
MKLPFKSPKDFLEFCNQQFSEIPQKGEGRPALVPPRGYMNIDNHVSRTEDSRYRVSLIVCGAPKGFFLIAETPNPGGEPISHGDLVIWKAFAPPPLLGKGVLGGVTGDKRSSWVGFIVAKIAPEIDEAGKFTVLSRYP